MGARILVIEDNPANLDLMTYLLRVFGHDPLSTTDGREGLEIARAAVPDLIVCDIQLPTMDGYEVARRLKADPRLRAIPLLAITAFAMPGDREKSLEAGFDGYVPKPIAPEAVIRQLDAFLPPALRSSPRQGAPRAASPPAVAPTRGTILVVDDSTVNLELVRSTLEPKGYKLIGVHSLAEAVAINDTHAIDLILSDLHMPDGDGYELIRVMKTDPRSKDIPVVIISSTSSGTIDPRTAAALGATGLIVRPIDPADLVAQVDACMNPRAGVGHAEDPDR